MGIWLLRFFKVVYCINVCGNKKDIFLCNNWFYFYVFVKSCVLLEKFGFFIVGSYRFFFGLYKKNFSRVCFFEKEKIFLYEKFCYWVLWICYR